MAYFYQAYHLNIQSDLKFLELLPAPATQPTQIDVSVQFGDVSPLGLNAPLKKSEAYQASVNELWLNVPDVARFLVTHGQMITIDPIKGADEDDIRLFVLGSCMGALLMQRGFLVLHGNVVRFNNVACVFTGASGAGKSTLAAAFFKQGYDLLADDICAVNQKGEVIPGFPQMKLWKDAAASLSIDITQIRKIRPELEKYAIPLKNQFYNEPLPLKAIYILAVTQEPAYEIERLTGCAKLNPLQDQTYRKYFLEGLGLTRQHLLRYTHLSQHITLTKMTRPKTGYSMDKLMTHIIDDFTKGYSTCKPMITTPHSN